MSDRIQIGVGILVLLLSSLACNAFAGRTDILPPPPMPTATASVEVTPAQSNLAPTVTLPADVPMESVEGTVRILVDLNIRSGPGVRFERVGFLLRDQRVGVFGRDTQSGWWRIQCPSGADSVECWVSGGSQFTLFESAE